MKKLIFGILATVFLALGCTEGNDVHSLEEGRLKLEDSKRLEGWGYLALVCDTHNGTLIYASQSRSESGGMAIALLPNGCNKIKDGVGIER